MFDRIIDKLADEWELSAYDAEELARENEQGARTLEAETVYAYCPDAVTNLTAWAQM